MKWKKIKFTNNSYEYLGKEYKNECPDIYFGIRCG